MNDQRKTSRAPAKRSKADARPAAERLAADAGRTAVAPADAVPELSRPVHLDRLPAGGVALDITASRTEAAALAQRFGFAAIETLAARVTVDRKPSGLVSIEGRLRARIVQDCVVTLDPVEQVIDEPFRLSLAPRSHFSVGADGELEVSADPDAPDPLEGNLLDVGELVAEHLALVADPYPRRPGVSLEEVLDRKAADREVRSSPFAVLDRLRRDPDVKK